MAFELHRVPGLPGVAASAINDRQAVALVAGDTQRRYKPIASNNIEPLGIAAASAPTVGDAVTVYDQGHIVKVTACASLGAAQDVGIASTNGQYGLVSGASGVSVFRVGQSLTAAAAGEKFSVYVSPKQLSNLI